MKSISVKKIASVACGAMMIGAAFAGAVSTDSSNLASFPFFSNGEPNVKIVVGSAAMPSDAVAAANIAAMIGNLAYTSKDITVLGLEGLSATGGISSGTASANIEVTTPGVNPNVAYQMKTYVEGYLDSSSTDDRLNSMSSSNILNSDGTSGARKITNYESQLVNKVSIADNDASKTYTEEERYFAYAQTAYDSNSKNIQAKNPQIAYEAVFTNPIQFCSDATPSSTSTSADCDDQYETSKHRVKIKLLGSDWVIQGMTTQGTGTSATVKSVTLGKEVQYKEFMQIGDEAVAPNGVKVKLSDISNVVTGLSHQPPVTFDIFDKDGNKVNTVTLQEGGSEEYSGYGVVLKLWTAFTGLGNNNYAKVSMYSDKFTLSDGSNVNTENTQWSVSIVNGGTSYGASISRIQFKRIVVSNMNPGDSVSFIQKPELMKLTFNGLETTNYDNLNLATGSMNFPTSSVDTSTQDQSFVRFISDQSNAFPLQTTTNTVYYIVDGVGSGASGQGTLFYQDSGYFKPYFASDGVYQSYGTINAASGASLNFLNSVATYNSTGSFCQNVNILSLNSAYAGGDWNFSSTGATSNAALNLSTQACGDNAGYATVNAGNKLLTMPTTNVRYNAVMNFLPYQYGSKTVWVKLDSTGITSVGDPDYVNNVISIPEFTTDDDNTQGNWVFDVGAGDSNSPKLVSSSGTGYFHYQNGGFNSFEPGFISMRGSKGASLSSTSATINYATTLAHALYSLTKATTSSSTSPNTQANDYIPGSTVLEDGGYRIIVKGINGGVSGNSSASINGIENIHASVSQADSVVNLNTASKPLVVLDDNVPTGVPLIVVGGNVVNAVASQVLGASPMTSSTEAMVKVYGDKIIVAGWTAEDTTSASEALINWLASNKIQGR